METKGVKVSIIIPVYQVSVYIERCIKSVLNQTYQDIECIIVDDATLDDSIEKCEKCIKEYNGPIQFIIIHHGVNRGLSATRNTGTKSATGEYLYYLDGDDYISVDCIEKLVSYALEDETIEMVQGNHIRICDGEEEIKRMGYVRIADNDDARRLFYDLHHIQVYVWNKLLKRSFVVENHLYCKEGIINEDDLWSFYLLKCLRNAYLCDSVTYYYHIRPNSIMTGSDGVCVGNSFVAIYNEILDNLSEKKEREELYGHLYTFCKRYLVYFKDAAALSGTMDLYKKRAVQYRCWLMASILIFVYLFRFIRKSISILQKLNIIRLFIVKERQFMSLQNQIFISNH